ncbi:pentapeptide repeat-containing protein [Halopseudomonas sp.]|jgi:hypothetical protein|uniref:pentapeptide repeat-containing protein n=1 Tax=Halopseudomonas sp. TaxID=2901191 RepID=UPI0039E6060D
MDISSASHVRLKLKHDAKILQRKLIGLQKSTAAFESDKRRKPTLTGCKKLIVQKHYDTYRDGFAALDHLENFAVHNYSTGDWLGDYDKNWRPFLHTKQAAALKEAEATGVPLKRCADKMQVSFDGFHFSSMLYTELFPSTISFNNFAHPNMIDFTGITANGSFIEQIWLGVVSSFAQSSLKQAKFYSGTCELCRPGTNTYRMDFSEANLSHADLRFSYLRGCKFTNAVLEGTDFRCANLFECDFAGATGIYRSTTEGDERIEYFRYFDEATEQSPLDVGVPA